MTVQFAPAGTRIMEVSRHRVLSSATAPIQRSLTIKVRGFPSRRAKRIGGLRRVFLHQSTARRFTTLRAAPRKNNDGVWTGTFYPSRLARYSALHCRLVLDCGTAALMRVVLLRNTGA